MFKVDVSTTDYGDMNKSYKSNGRFRYSADHANRMYVRSGVF